MWVIKNAGRYEVTPLPEGRYHPGRICVAPVDPETGEQVNTAEFLDVAYYYLTPDNVRVDIAENGIIPLFWKLDEQSPSWTSTDVQAIDPQASMIFDPTRRAEASINTGLHTTFVAAELARAQARKNTQIENKYRELCAEDYLWTDGKLYQVSDDLRDGLNAINTGLYADRPWMAKDNTLKTFTVAEFKALGKAIFDRGDAYFVVKQIKKAEVNSLTTIAAVNAYDINAGWT
jgi:hypothetical protein